jgi:hypothetical protein
LGACLAESIRAVHRRSRGHRAPEAHVRLTEQGQVVRGQLDCHAPGLAGAMFLLKRSMFPGSHAAFAAASRANFAGLP